MSKDVEELLLNEELSRLNTRSDTEIMDPPQDTQNDSVKLLYERYRQHGKLEDLERCITKSREEVQLAGDNDQRIAYALQNLAFVLQARFESCGRQGDLEEVITSCQHILELTPDGDANMPSRLSNLGVALCRKFESSGRSIDLQDAIAHYTRVIELTPEGSPDMFMWLSNLGNALQKRFECFGSSADLQTAIIHQTRALELIPKDDIRMSLLLNNLGYALKLRFESSGSTDDLQDVVSHFTRAVELTAESCPDMPLLLDSLGHALRTRFESSGNPVDLQDAIAHHMRAVELTSESSPHMLLRLNNLGIALWTQFEASGNSTDLEDALTHFRRAIDLAQEGNPHLPLFLSNLGLALWTRFESSGNSADLQEAIGHHTRALELTPDGSTQMPIRLNNLGNALWTRFQHSENPIDLGDAIVHYTRAIELTPEGSPHLPKELHNLGNTFYTRFHALGSSDDLRDAIARYYHAIQITPEGSPDMPIFLSSLGRALTTQFESLGNSVDLQDAIAQDIRAIELTPEGSPSMPPRLYSLSYALELRYKSSKDSTDLQESVASVSRAIRLTLSSHPWRAMYSYHLGDLLCLRMESGCKEMDDEVQAMRAFTEAMEQASGDPHWRVQAGLKYIELLSTNPSTPTPPPFTILYAHQYVLDLIPRAIWLGYDVKKRYKKLTDLRMSVIHAAADAIAVGEYQRALEWLECSRAIVWAQVLQLRIPLDNLSKHHPQLASRLQTAATALQKDTSQLSMSTFTSSGSQAQNVVESNDDGLSSSKEHLQTRAKDTYDFALEYDCVIEEIKAHEGFENFLRPKQTSQLMPACTSGPIVIINVHTSRCDALLLVHNEDIIHVPLPLFSYDHARELQTRLWSFVRRRPKARNGMHDGGDRDLTDPQVLDGHDSVTDDEQDTMRSILADLWVQVVQPVINALEHRGLFECSTDGNLPHITWCPTGPLVFLPLHAAGIYPPHGLSETIMDIAVSSYTPTLDTLLRPRARRDIRGDTTHYPKLFVVHQPNVPGYAPIPRTVDEAEEIRGAFRSRANIVDGPNGTIETVIEGMRTHDWVHLACHGMQDSKNRLDSAFALSDGRLTLSRLMSEYIPSAELAVLSACQTAMGDEDLPEEAVHLAAGMLNVGYKSVIGTMWSIYDDSAPIVMRPFYRIMSKQVGRGGELQPAYALHEATRVLRKKVGERNFMQWVPYVHFGL
ncbi:CHAT domain-containing protein [Irpex rosettiformis]|uniref:CHAT domain-containing protein n=1 Tax=Irpex rosettiformis TaxID=378272 RepID=A0ACB8TNJ6_9APHY|nr:CHAT domain-containing protein [Irpex rosettiformis]